MFVCPLFPFLSHKSCLKLFFINSSVQKLYFNAGPSPVMQYLYSVILVISLVCFIFSRKKTQMKCRKSTTRHFSFKYKSSNTGNTLLYSSPCCRHSWTKVCRERARTVATGCCVRAHARNPDSQKQQLCGAAVAQLLHGRQQTSGPGGKAGSTGRVESRRRAACCFALFGRE